MGSKKGDSYHKYEHGSSIRIDALGNIYTIGQLYDTADVNPGPGIFNINGPGLFILKLTSSGNFIWAEKVIAIGNKLALDKSANIYITGMFYYSQDFDPGVGIDSLSTHGVPGITQNAFILKLDSAGNHIWAKQIGGKGSSWGRDIGFDSKENVYVLGNFMDTADFDPGAGTYTMIAQYGDPFILKLSPSPSPAGSIAGSTVVCGNSTNTYIIDSVSGATGYNWTIPSDAIINSGQNTRSINIIFGTSSGIITVTPVNSFGNGTSKAMTITVNPKPVVGHSVSPATTVCAGIAITLNGTGASSYSWSGSINNGVAFVPSSTTKYFVIGTDSNGCTNIDSVMITVNALPIVSFTVSPSSTICKGSSVILNGTGASSYVWTGGVINGVPFIPTITTTYIVTGTNVPGCK